MNKTSNLELEWNKLVHHESEIHMLHDATLDVDTNRKWQIYIFKQTNTPISIKVAPVNHVS